MLQTVYITCGVPGSGKSTWSNLKVQENPELIIICRDGFRSMIRNGYIFDPMYEPFIIESAFACLSLAITTGFNVIVDETNVTCNIRNKWITVVREKRPEVKIVCAYFPETSRNLDNRMKDPRGYSKEKWAEVIGDMRAKFEEPSINEGFDEIIQPIFF